MSLRKYLSRFSYRAIAALVAATGLIALASVSPPVSATQLISREQARRLGLERAWFGQVRLDRARNQVERAILAGNRLDVLTTAGVVHEFNALTGETLWIAPVGNPQFPSLGPSASEQYVAVVNGSTLYVLDRTDGRPAKVRRLGGAPGAAPVLTTGHVFVPLLSGRIEGYPLGKEVFTPWYFQSVGRTLVPPVATPSSVVWATDAGVVYVGGAEVPGVRFSLETRSEILAPPAFHRSYIYVATMSGELFAIDESSGAKRWKYSAGFPITHAPAAVGPRVYITTEEPVMHCVDAANGTSVWEAPKLAQFVAASRNRVYGIDDYGALVVLDAATGALLGRMPTSGSTSGLVNDQTDRLYLVSSSGMVQCLHEIGAKEPLYHAPPEVETVAEQTPAGETDGQPPAAAAAPQQPADAAPLADEGDVFQDDPEAATEETDMEAEEQPADDSVFGVEENLFGEEP
jgi:outer membrane protein assembly factor BamB